MDKKIIINIFFVFVVFTFFIWGFYSSIFKVKDINEYENRTAYKYGKFSIKGFMNETLQDGIEKTLSDQIPFSYEYKEAVNMFDSYYINSFSNIFLKNDCLNKYVLVKSNVYTFNCENVLVFNSYNFDSIKAELDSRIDNINDVVARSNDVEFILYYIEREYDLNFETNKKLNVYEYLKDKINIDNIGKFEINNFSDYKKYFYRTDHHWNYQGSYKAYLEILDLLNTNDVPLIPVKTIHTDKNINGSMTNKIGNKTLYNESFSYYEFNYPKYVVGINGKDDYDYGGSLDNGMNSMYPTFYGISFGEIIIDYNQPEKDNILVIGDSFDNAILKLLGSHYNKLYSVDLRHYERENNKKFNYKKYIQENNIDKLLYICNVDFLLEDEFILE